MGFLNKIKNGFIPDYSDANDIAEKYLFETIENKAINAKLLVEYLTYNY